MIKAVFRPFSLIESSHHILGDLTMPLDTYQNQARFWLINSYGPTSTAGLSAFRGDLVILEGEFNETARKHGPPRAAVKDAVLLASTDKLHFVSGNLASIDELPEFVERFQNDLAPDCVPVFFVDNIADSAQVEIGPHRYVLIKFDDGIVWNSLMDEFYVEKADLKGLSAEDKVVVVHEAAKGHGFKYPVKSLEEVIANKTASRRGVWGAV
jgi:hypothetical protein